MTNENTKLAYIEAKADKAHRTLDRLCNGKIWNGEGTNEQYELVIAQVKKAEREIEYWENEFDKEFERLMAA